MANQIRGTIQLQYDTLAADGFFKKNRALLRKANLPEDVFIHIS